MASEDAARFAAEPSQSINGHGIYVLAGRVVPAHRSQGYDRPTAPRAVRFAVTLEKEIEGVNHRAKDRQVYGMVQMMYSIKLGTNAPRIEGIGRVLMYAVYCSHRQSSIKSLPAMSTLCDAYGVYRLYWASIGIRDS